MPDSSLGLSVGRKRVLAGRAYDVFCQADYALGTAAAVLDEAEFPEWATEADDLMRKCIELRERIHKEAGL